MKGVGRGKKFQRVSDDYQRDLGLSQTDSSGHSSPTTGTCTSRNSLSALASGSGSDSSSVQVPPTAALVAGRGTGRGLFRPPPAQSYIYQPPSSPSPLICGPLRPIERIAILDTSSSSSDDVNRNSSEEEDLVAQLRRLNAGLPLGRGRGRVQRGVLAISSDESEASHYGTNRFGFDTDARRLMSPISPLTSTPLPLSSSSPSFSSSYSETGSDDANCKRVVTKHGEKGTIVPIAANYIWLNKEENKGIFQYHVHFDPPFEHPRPKIVMLREHTGILGIVRNFDGAKLFLPFKLIDRITELESFNPNDPEVRVKISVKFIEPKGGGVYMRDYIQFCNILFRKIMSVLGLININRQFFNVQLNAIHRLPAHRLEIWPGYVTAIDEREGGLMLCCDATSRVLRTSTMLNLWQDTVYASQRNGEIELKERYKNYVVGKIVLTRYNNRHYRIDDVDYEQNPLSTFSCRGEEITFAAYYQSQYSIRIIDLEQPLLFHLPKPKKNDPRQAPLAPVLLIPELCFMTGLTEEITSDFRIMKDISNCTRLTPEQRNQHLEKFLANVNSNKDAVKILKDWGLTLSENTTKLEGRIVGEDLAVKLNPKYEFTLKSKGYEFSSEAKNHPCYEPVEVQDWALFYPPREKDKAEKMRTKYAEVCRTLGIRMRQGSLFEIEGRRNEDYRQCIANVLQNRPNLQFFAVIMQRRQDDLYGMIKRLCCVDKPVPSQVILAKTLNDPRKIHSIMSKIALQINCKIGGGLWTIRMPRAEKIMFVGMDVYHDPRQKASSVTALVASLNDIHTKYYSNVVRQRTHQETMASLRPIFVDALKQFYIINNGWPDRVLVWRDGIGDGELETTKQFEVVQLSESLGKYCDNSPKFTYTVVQKRINTRIFAEDTRKGLYVNPVPGTVLDHTITRRYHFDFFLVSQLIQEGTVTPTHYIVLEDNSNIAPDLIQKFAFATSFMYYNWAGSIRVPAVCQYAHKLAYLVGQYIQCDPSDQLCKQLYYL